MQIPSNYRNANKHPQPVQYAEIPLMAPNMMSQVQKTIDEHPEIDTMDEEVRGEVIDITDWRVNGGIETPWGRKARVNDPNNPQLNTDGMTYLRPDSLFEIYDCISGIDGNASWEGYGPYAPGENGYWWPPQPVEGTVTPTPPTDDYQQQIDALNDRIEVLESNGQALSSKVSEMQNQIDSLTNTLAGGLHTHGPVDLPIVVESLTRMRAKGDIDVSVKPGTAVPPTDSGETFGILDALMLKRILNRDEPEEGKKKGSK